MSRSEQISVVSALVAALSVLCVFYFALKNYRREKANQNMSYFLAKQKYFEDLRQWADQLTDVLSEAVHLCELDPPSVAGESFFDRRLRIRRILSSMIDRGRWFFPNVVSDEHGRDKPLAFRGYRHEVLDSLVAAYRVLTDLDYKFGDRDRQARSALIEAKREFVSQIQKVLDPRGRQDEFEKITKAVART